MLPSQAKKALTDYFLERLEASELNYRGDPKYNYDRAHQEFFAAKSPGDDFWTTATFTECFTTAYKEYEALRLQQGCRQVGASRARPDR